MPRVLSDAPSRVTFYDKISDTRIVLEYRMPTTEERIAYSNALVTRKGTKIKSAIGETRQKFGLKILTGFERGAFALDNGALMASRPDEDGFDPAWKAKVAQFAPDLIDALAITVFESSVVRDDDETEGDGDEPDPS